VGRRQGVKVRAVVHDRYGPPEVLRVEEVEPPVPAADEILVRVRATTVSRTDCHARKADPFLWRFFLGLRRPKKRILGCELAGEVVEVGSSVTQFEVGDHVFAASSFGTHAEFMCKRETGAVAHKPSGITFEQAAASCDGVIGALSGLRAAGVREGQAVLVYGASGSVGTAGVQIAKHLGAHVTAVCNTKNVELVRTLGADVVIDYLEEDFTKNGEQYDVVFDAVGKHSFRRCRRSLKPSGIYLPTDLGFMWHVPLLVPLSRLGNKRVKFAVGKTRKDDVLYVKGLLEAGEYRPVIERTYPLEQVVEATRYVETGQKTGNVVLTLDG
jgi:NADPH:quinone reductase-like Zn-dependent oxidoreductase